MDPPRWSVLVSVSTNQQPRVRPILAHSQRKSQSTTGDHKDGLFELRYKGVVIQAGFENVGGYYSICFMGVYGPILNRVSSSDIVVDGGANIGVFSILAARKAKLVYAVEPNPDNFATLCSNLVANNCSNVIPVRAALSESVGEAFLEGTGEVSHLASRGLPIKTVTIDSVSSGKATCIKLDVEGATMLAMRGVHSLDAVHTICFEVEEEQLETLSQDLPRIGIDPGSYAMLIDSLKRQGYAMENYNRIGVQLRNVMSRDLIDAELKTNFFATRAFARLLVGSGKNLFRADSLQDPRIDTLYFIKSRNTL